jgi:hypothetical protein
MSAEVLKIVSLHHSYLFKLKYKNSNLKISLNLNLGEALQQIKDGEMGKMCPSYKKIQSFLFWKVHNNSIKINKWQLEHK